MAIPTIAVGDRIKASTINKIIQLLNGTALGGIVPTSAEGDGVTVSPLGKVTFANSAKVSLNGVFSGTYDNYRVTWSLSTSVATGSQQFALRSAGVDYTSGTYDFVRTVAAGTSQTITSSSSASSFPLDTGVSAGQKSSGAMDIFGPALLDYTTGDVTSSVFASSAISSCRISFANELAATFDGFSLYPLTSGETITGWVRVYGYNTLV